MAKLYLGTTLIKKAIFKLVELTKLILGGVEINIGGEEEPSAPQFTINEDGKGFTIHAPYTHEVRDSDLNLLPETKTMTEDLVVQNYTVSQGFNEWGEQTTDYAFSSLLPAEARATNTLANAVGIDFSGTNTSMDGGYWSGGALKSTSSAATAATTHTLVVEYNLSGLHPGGTLTVPASFMCSISDSSGNYIADLSTDAMDGSVSIKAILTSASGVAETKNLAMDWTSYQYKTTFTTPSATATLRLEITLTYSTEFYISSIGSAFWDAMEKYVDTSVPYYIYISCTKQSSTNYQTYVGIRKQPSNAYTTCYAKFNINSDTLKMENLEMLV